MPAGSYAITVRAYKAPSTSAPILSKSVTVTGGEDASIVANLTASGSPTLSVFANPTTPVPVGDARVIVRHVAEAPGVDVYAGTSKVITDLTNPDQAALVIPRREGPCERGRDRYHHHGDRAGHLPFPGW